jgi:hypothetical protein
MTVRLEDRTVKLKREVSIKLTVKPEALERIKLLDSAIYSDFDSRITAVCQQAKKNLRKICRRAYVQDGVEVDLHITVH